MSLKKTLILGLFVAAALFYIFKVELPKEAAKQDAVKLTPGITGAQLEKIELVSSKGSFALVNTAPQPANPNMEDEANGPGKGKNTADSINNWQLEGAKGSELDPSVFNQLINAISDFKGDDSIPAADLSGDKSVYGLKEPLVKIKVLAPQKSTEVQFGKKNDYLQKRYAQFAGRDEVYLVSDTLFLAADKSQNDFRSKSPVQFVDADVSAVTVRGGEQSTNEKVKLVRTDAGWEIAEPQKFKAAESSVSTLTTALRSVQASDFIDGDNLKLGDYGLDSPALSAVVDFKESLKKSPLVLKIATVKQESSDKDNKAPPSSTSYLSIEGKPSIFKLAADPLGALKVSVDDYREKQLFKFATDQVKEITFTRSGGELKLTKTDSQWKVGEKEGDDTFIKELLASLSGLTATAFPIADQDFGFKSPTFKVTVSFTGDFKPRTLVIGSEAPGGGSFAGVDDLSEPFVIGADSLKRINAREEVLAKPPTPVASPKAQPPIAQTLPGADQ